MPDFRSCPISECQVFEVVALHIIFNKAEDILLKYSSIFSEGVLGPYNGKNLILSVPEGKSLEDMRSLSVWCRKFTVRSFFRLFILPYENFMIIYGIIITKKFSNCNVPKNDLSSNISFFI